MAIDEALPARSLGQLFPAGGPVDPDLVVGRVEEVAELVALAVEGVHTMLLGPRRIGKTTVCVKVCAELAGTHSVIRIEVPERRSSEELLRLVVARCEALSLKDEVRAGLRAARPWLTTFLRTQGVDLDLSEVGAGRDPSPREILELPLAVARESRRPVLLFFDELQRVADYEDGDQLLIDLVDIYSGQQRVVLLVDGSEERALEGILGPPVHFAKLCRRRDLSPTIPRDIWRAALRERFSAAGTAIDESALEALLDFGQERPYPTMTAALDSALAARRTASGGVERFEVQMGIDEAKERLRDEDA